MKALEGPDDDEIEREELLLAQRKGSPGRGNQALAAAASRKLAGISEQPARPSAPARARLLGEDAVTERAERILAWLRKHRRTLGLTLVAATAALGVMAALWARHTRTREAASIAFTDALATQEGEIGDSSKAEKGRPKPAYTFASTEARSDALLAKYDQVAGTYPKTAAGYLASLNAAAVRLDKGDLDGAANGFNQAKVSPLAKVDVDVRARALEGIGFVEELRAAANPGGRDAHLEKALAAFRELENTDTQGLKELGMIHQARVFEAKGDIEKAKELLKALHERLSKPPLSALMTTLTELTDDRLRRLDPTAVPPKPNANYGGGMGGMGGLGGANMNDPQMRKLIEQLKAQQGAGTP